MKKLMLSLSLMLVAMVSAPALAYYVYCPYPYRPAIATGYQYVWTGYGWALQAVSYWVCVWP